MDETGEATQGVLTPFWILYALHDALVKPMPGNPMAAEPGGILEPATPDKLTYEFKLRQGLKFHNRRPVHRRGREIQLRALESGR